MVLTNDDMAPLQLSEVASDDCEPILDTRYSGPLRAINSAISQATSMAILQAKARAK